MISGLVHGGPTTSHSSGPSHRVAVAPRFVDVLGFRGSPSAWWRACSWSTRKFTWVRKATSAIMPAPAMFSVAWARYEARWASGLWAPLLSVTTPPLGIVEDGFRDGRRDGSVAHRRVKDSAQKVPPACHEREGERALQGRAPVARRHVTHHWRGGGTPVFENELSPFRQKLTVVKGKQPDEVLAVGARGVGPRQRPLPDEVALLCRHDPRHAEIVWRDRAVGFLPDDDVAFLGSHQVHRLGPVGSDLKPLAGVHNRLPQGVAVPCGDVDLIGELPREAHP